MDRLYEEQNQLISGLVTDIQRISRIISRLIYLKFRRLSYVKISEIN